MLLMLEALGFARIGAAATGAQARNLAVAYVAADSIVAACSASPHARPAWRLYWRRIVRRSWVPGGLSMCPLWTYSLSPKGGCDRQPTHCRLLLHWHTGFLRVLSSGNCCRNAYVAGRNLWPGPRFTICWVQSAALLRPNPLGRLASRHSGWRNPGI